VSDAALTAIVVVETIVLGLLAVIVVALLRSHAEILRRLPADAPQAPHNATAPDDPTIPVYLPQPTGSVTVAHDIAGSTLEGEVATISMTSGTDTLVTFLSTGCLTCRSFWQGLREGAAATLPGLPRVIVVVKDRELESPSKLRELAPNGLPVLYSSEAWSDFGISMSPYFCFVDGRTGAVRFEGAATSWPQVASLLRDALLDEELAAETRAGR
jgi:hypothetical protein